MADDIRHRRNVVQLLLGFTFDGNAAFGISGARLIPAGDIYERFH
jgi:hypothetical protein